MSNKCKVNMLIVSLVVAIGVMLAFSGSGMQKAVEAFVLHNSHLADATDGTSPPDYRFIQNHREETSEDIKEGIAIPAVIVEATKHRCGVLIQRLDAGRLLGKFDVGYMVVCYEKYPELFRDYFKEFIKAKSAKVESTVEEVEVEEEVETETESTAVVEEEVVLFTEITGTYYTTTTSGSAMYFMPEETSLLEDGEYLRLMNSGDLLSDKDLYEKFGFPWETSVIEGCDAFNGTATILAEKFEENWDNSWSYKLTEVKEMTDPVCGEYREF